MTGFGLLSGDVSISWRYSLGASFRTTRVLPANLGGGTATAYLVAAFVEALLDALRRLLLVVDDVVPVALSGAEPSLSSDEDMTDAASSGTGVGGGSLSSGSTKRTTGSGSRGTKSENGRLGWVVTGGLAPSKETGLGLGAAKAERNNGERLMLFC